ncbi:MAG: hypothetical protein KDD15_16920 [Lewinella sp.]|nr:hypothetical protein [Lewinella sp.]
MSNRLLPLLLLVLFLAPACKKQENVRIKLTSRERELIDTIYTERIKVLRPKWDSMCTASHDSLLQIALDSIIRVRRVEEARLRSRIVIPQ